MGIPFIPINSFINDRGGLKIAWGFLSDFKGKN